MLDDKTLKRFWAKVDKRGPDECWPWTGARGSGGYGVFTIDRTNFVASRVACAIKHDGFPLKVEKNRAFPSLALHSCDNPPCCNPAHLRCGTWSDNGQDVRERKRQNPAFGVANSSAKLTEADVFEIRRVAVDWDGMCDMMKKHRVGQLAIESIVKRKSWRHI